MKIKKVYESEQNVSTELSDNYVTYRIMSGDNMIYQGELKNFLKSINIIKKNYNKENYKKVKIEELSEDEIRLLIDTNNFNL